MNNATIVQFLATAAQQSAAGRIDLAAASYTSILHHDPNHVEALGGLGLIALQKGDYGEAIGYFTRTIAAGGAGAFYWNRLGVAYTAAGRLGEAVAAFEEALRYLPDFAEAFNNLGVALEHQGLLERAVQCHRQAIRLRPACADLYFNLGNVLSAQAKHEEATEAYRHGLTLNPNHPEIFNKLGLILQAQGEIARAAECYREALRLCPSHAFASNNLASAMTEQGLLDEALAQHRATLEVHPDHALTLANLSQFAAEGRYRFDAADLARIKARLASKQGPGLERSLLAFTLAAVLDQQGVVNEAFAFYRQANELRREVFQKRNQAFDAEKHRATVDRLIAAVDKSFFARVEGWGVDSELPVFIVGMPRSGSTLVEQILCSHPQVHGTGEVLRIAQALTGWAKETGGGVPHRAPVLIPDRSAAQELASVYLRQLAELGGAALRVTDKTLGNFLYLGVIAALFPRARIVHCRRDPLDVCLSCYFQNFRDVDFAWSLEDIGAYHRQYERVMAHWRKVLLLEIHEVRYEELIARPAEVTRNLLEYCGLPWHEGCLAFYDNRRPVQTASALQVRRPLSAQAIGRWKRYRAHLAPLFQALGLPTPSDAKTLRQGDLPAPGVLRDRHGV